MGDVYEAYDPRLKRIVAIKAIRSTSNPSDPAFDRLRLEAITTASLSHPLICRVFDLLEEGSTTLIVMERIEGETLQKRLARGAMPLGEALRFVSEVAEALAEAHAKGLAHCDIKPSNLMITPEGHARVLDFGIARLHALGAAEITRTSPPVAVGTPRYAAPEQALGRAADARTDVFALGVLLFQCVTARFPFDGDDEFENLKNALEGHGRRISESVSGAPHELDRIVSKCLSPSPDDRYQSAQPFLVDLLRAQEALTKPPSRFSRVAVIAAILMAVGLAVVWWTVRPAGRPATPNGELSALVTWPSEEHGSRFSPDGKWVSFVSNRDGASRIWLQNLSGGEPRALSTPDGEIIGHAWAPDGGHVAYVIETGDGQFLQIVPAFFGGSPLVSYQVGRTAAVVRWIGQTVYLELEKPRSLVGIDSKTGQMTTVVEEQTLRLDAVQDFDIGSDGSVALSGERDRRRDIWVLRPTSGALDRVTDDDAADFHPRWAAARSLVFQSTRGGQPDTWHASLNPASTRQMTFGAYLSPDDVSTDGTQVLLHHDSDHSDLWESDLRAGGSWQVTADSLSDASPTLSVNSDLFAFQRRPPSAAAGYGYRYIDGQIFVGRRRVRSTSDSLQRIADGFSPVLSADARWLAYLRRTDEGLYRTALRLVDLGTQQDTVLTPAFQLSGFHGNSGEWVSTNVIWSPNGDLYFTDWVNKEVSIRRYSHSTHAVDARPLVASTADSEFRDLNVSPDGTGLSFVRYAAGSWRLQRIDLPNREEHAVFATRQTIGETLLARGWRKSALVVVRARRPLDLPQMIEVLAANDDGVTTIARLPDTLGSTVRFDRSQGALLMTRVENHVPNLYALSIDHNRWLRLTDNTLPSVSFSAIATTETAAVMFVRTERHRDIWIARYNNRW